MEKAAVAHYSMYWTLNPRCKYCTVGSKPLKYTYLQCLYHRFAGVAAVGANENFKFTGLADAL